MRARTTTLFICTAWVAASAISGCGDFFEDAGGGGRNRSGKHCDDDGDGRRGGGRDTDPLAVHDAGPVATRPDATIVPVADAGTAVRADAETQPVLDAGAVIADAGELTPPDAGRDCSDGQCPCVRDNDCPDELVCDHAAALCVAPPVRCADRASEVDCLAETTCQPVYAGQNCRDAQGGECTTGDLECTCESFSFALCADR